jgi:hypothetical protein
MLYDVVGCRLLASKDKSNISFHPIHRYIFLSCYRVSYSYLVLSHYIIFILDRKHLSYLRKHLLGTSRYTFITNCNFNLVKLPNWKEFNTATVHKLSKNHGSIQFYGLRRAGLNFFFFFYGPVFFMLYNTLVHVHHLFVSDRHKH